MSPLSASFVGKLPLSAEFVRHTRGAPELDELDVWLQEGLDRARIDRGPGWEASYDAASASRFLYFSRRTRTSFAGVLVSSRDRAGRRYPFVLGSRVVEEPAGAAFERLPISLARFLTEALMLAGSGWVGAGLQEYRERLGRGSWTVRDEEARRIFADYLRSRPASALWAVEPLDADETARTRFLHRLWRHSVDPGRRGAVLQVPVGEGNAGVAFWLAVLRSWSPAGFPPTLAVWGEPDGAGRTRLRVVQRRLSAADFAPVFWSEDAGETRPERAAPETPHQIARGERLFAAASAWPDSMQSLLDELSGVANGGNDAHQ
jgi:type VI secretion system ImpM family protein